MKICKRCESAPAVNKNGYCKWCNISVESGLDNWLDNWQFKHYKPTKHKFWGGYVQKYDYKFFQVPEY